MILKSNQQNGLDVVNFNQKKLTEISLSMKIQLCNSLREFNNEEN